MPKKAEKFQDLEVWQKAHQLVLVVYKITRTFPSEEKFGLVPQMRRSGVSIAANIAEGFKKRGARDKSNFYNIAQGSLEELRYYFILSKDLSYLRTNDELLEAVDVIGRMLHGLVISVRPEHKYSSSLPSA
jgi:four helix bundle protein